MKPDSIKKHIKYKEEFPELLIKHFQNGGSMSSFVAVAKVSRETLYVWTREIPEFGEAYEIAKGQYQKLMETILVAKATGNEGQGFDLKKSDLTAVIFALKTRCYKDYGNKDKLELSGAISTQNLDELSDDQLEQRLALLKKVNGDEE